MATLTVKNIPDDLYARLKETAALHRRSINSEIIVCIERSLRPRRLSAEEILERAREVRGRWAGAPLTAAELAEARTSGRP